MSDSDEEIKFIQDFCSKLGVKVALSEVWEKGGEGGLELADKIEEVLANEKSNFKVLYDEKETIENKILKIAKEIYGADKIDERHRHRFEYNNDYKERLEEAGLICSGVSPDGSLVEIVEIKEHPYFIAGQFHPELKSRPNRPAPLFVGLIKAAK